MPVIGVHTLLYTSEPDELRQVLAEVFGWRSVDAGEGWLIFAVPPAEMGVHPSDQPSHAISMMCDDLEATMADLTGKGIEFRGEPQDEGYGIVATMVLPGDVEVDLYEPRHPVAIER